MGDARLDAAKAVAAAICSSSAMHLN